MAGGSHTLVRRRGRAMTSTQPAASGSPFDVPVSLTRPPVMVSLVLVVLVLAVGLYAAFSSTVTTTADGTGVLLNGGTSIAVAAPAVGQLANVSVGAGDVVAAQQPIAQINGLQGGSTQVVAPSAGTVVQMVARAGSAVKPGDVVAQLVDTQQPLLVSGFVPESEMSGVQVGALAQVYPLAASTSPGYLAGTVTFVDGLVASDALIGSVLGSEQLGQLATVEGPVRLIQVGLDQPVTDPASLQWTGTAPASPLSSGSPVRIEVVTGQESVASLLGGP